MTSLPLCPAGLLSALYILLLTIKACQPPLHLLLFVRKDDKKEEKGMNRVRISPGRGGVNVYANHRRTCEDAPDLHGAGGAGVCVQTASRWDGHNHASRWMLCWGSVEAMIGPPSPPPI